MKRYAYLVLLLLSFYVAVMFRVRFGQNVLGDDIATYESAMTTFMDGQNPYTYTVTSFQDKTIASDKHGYAYLPGLLYILTALYKLYLFTGYAGTFNTFLFPFAVTLDIGIGFLLYHIISKKDRLAGVFAFVLWTFNPYVLSRHGFAYKDFLAVLFLLLASVYQSKKQALTGALLALSVSFKTFAVFALPIYLLLSKRRIHFVLGGFVTILLVSLPFMLNQETFLTYINGAFLVHGDRLIQGRPILYYISYLTHIEFFRIVPLKVYVWLSMLSSWPIVTYLILKRKCNDVYLLSSISFLCFYLFTPVLNKSYFIWGFPFFIVAMSNVFEGKKLWLYYLSTILIYLLCFWYLKIWDYGYHTNVPYW